MAKNRQIMRMIGTVDFVGFPFISVEARSGFEPLNKGFADLCLTTWLPRLLGRSLLGTYRAGPLKVNDSNRSSSVFGLAAGLGFQKSGFAETRPTSRLEVNAALQP